MATAFQLIGTGIGMGIVHVLTGPDHISALATLSSSSSCSSSSTRSPPVSKCYLFGLGARWGIGHSTGLLLVGGIFILKDILQRNNGGDDSNSDRIEIPEVVTRLFESLVGIFMLLLGIYGIREAHKIKNGQSVTMDANVAYTMAEDTSSSSNGDDDVGIPTANNSMRRRRYSDDVFDDEKQVSHFEVDENSGSACHNDNDEDFESNNNGNDLEEFRYNVQVMLGTVSTNEEGANVNHGHHHHHHDHHHDSSNSPFLALCAGIFHGLAGPGGVLGVVPAIQLHNGGLAACYLLSFCASSTLTMGTFAAAYGSFTAWLAKCCEQQQVPPPIATADSDSDEESGQQVSAATRVVEFWIRCVSASLSLLVGVAWLVLLAMGKLEDVFG